MSEHQPEEQNEAPTADNLDFTRRRFMGGVLGGAIAWVAAACGRDPATPTPTANPTATATPVARSSLIPTPTTGSNQVYLPLVENGGVAQVAMAPTATDTPVPPPTDTPEPTATPVPPATPFPPGPPSKLGLVVARNHPQIFDVLATKAITAVCTLELDAGFAAQIKQTSPSTRLIGRLDVPTPDMANFDPIASANEFVQKLLPFADDERRRPYFDGWQAYNEPVVNNADDMKRLAEFEAERTRQLGARGIRSVIGNFATGNPSDLALWSDFFPALQAAQENDGWLGLHEYSAPTIYFLSTQDNEGRYPGVGPDDTGWLTLRYRQVYNQILKPAGLAIPLVFTELGVDGLVQNNRPGSPDARGWQDFQSYWAENGFGLWGPGAYIEQLAWFDQAMRHDDYVIGGCIFAMAASQGWESYDILGPAAGVLQQYLSVHAPA